MFIDIVENNKKKHKSLIISSRRTPIKNMSLWFDDFFTCFIVQKPLYLHLQVCFSNGLQSHLYGIEINAALATAASKLTPIAPLWN